MSFQRRRTAATLGVVLALVIPGATAMTHQTAAAAVAAPVSVPATDDVFVSQAEPAKSFATAEWLSVCGRTCNGSTTGERRALARFKVSGVPENATKVTLTLEVTSARTTATTVRAHKVTGSWSTAATIWNTKPAQSTDVLGTHTGFTAGAVAKLDVSAAYTGNGTYSFGLTSADATPTVLHSSRAGGDKGPKLKVSYSTTAPTASPTATPTGSPTPTASPTSAPTCGPLPFDKPSAAALRASAKKAFAFYFPPFPVSIDNKDPAQDQYASWLNPLGSNGAYQAQGGYLRDRPQARAVRSGTDWRKADFETEVRQAIAQGLDGFIYEHHTSSDQRWNHMVELLDAAKSVDPGFKIMLSPDFPLTEGAAHDKVLSDILQAKDHPSLFKLADGRVPLAPFYPERQPLSWWKTLQDKLEAKGMKTALVPIFLYWNGTGRSDWNADIYGYASWGARFASMTDTYRKAGLEAKARGRIWMSPVAFEDVRPKEHHLWESSASLALRSSWEKAMEGDATWVSLMTWNDYSESWMNPSQYRGKVIGDVSAYYATWFKTGKKPAIVRDALYYFHRSHRSDAPYDTSKQTGGPIKVKSGDPFVDEVELLAFASAPGTLVIKQGTDVKTKEVTSAGMVSFKVPLVPGTTPVFQLKRGDQVVQTVTSKTPILKSVVYQDMIYHAGGGTACSG